MPQNYDFSSLPDKGYDFSSLPDQGYDPNSWWDWGVNQAIRTGPAIGGAMLGSFGGPIGTAVFGGLGAAVGSSLGNWYQGKPQNRGEIATEAALGAVPFFGEAPGAGAGLKQIGKYAGLTAAQGGFQGLAGSVPRHIAETGNWELPPLNEALSQGVGGAVFGGAMGLGHGMLSGMQTPEPMPRSLSSDYEIVPTTPPHEFPQLSNEYEEIPRQFSDDLRGVRQANLFPSEPGARETRGTEPYFHSIGGEREAQPVNEPYFYQEGPQQLNLDMQPELGMNEYPMMMRKSAPIEPAPVEVNPVSPEPQVSTGEELPPTVSIVNALKEAPYWKEKGYVGVGIGADGHPIMARPDVAPLYKQEALKTESTVSDKAYAVAGETVEYPAAKATPKLIQNMLKNGYKMISKDNIKATFKRLAEDETGSLDLESIRRTLRTLMGREPTELEVAQSANREALPGESTGNVAQFEPRSNNEITIRRTTDPTELRNLHTHWNAKFKTTQDPYAAEMLRTVEQQMRKTGVGIPGTVQGQADLYKTYSDRQLISKANYWEDNIKEGLDPSAMNRFDIDLLNEEMARRGMDRRIPRGPTTETVPPTTRQTRKPGQNFEVFNSNTDRTYTWHSSLEEAQAKVDKLYKNNSPEFDVREHPPENVPGGQGDIPINRMKDPREVVAGVDKPVPSREGQQELALGPSSELVPRELPQDANLYPSNEPIPKGKQPVQEKLPIRETPNFKSIDKAITDTWDELQRTLKREPTIAEFDAAIKAKGIELPPIRGGSGETGEPPTIGAKKKKQPSLLRQWFNLSRGLTTPLDLSDPLRQGSPLVFTKAWRDSWGPRLKALGSEGAYQKTISDIEARPLFKSHFDGEGNRIPSWAEVHGFKLADLHASREEATPSNWAESGEFLNKIPGAAKTYKETMGRGVRATDRAYTAGQNQLRADTFENLVNDAYREFQAGKKTPNPFEDAKFTREIIDYVDTVTGRAPMKLARPTYDRETGKWSLKESNFEQHAQAITDVMFSPRLTFSRMRMLNPMTYSMASPFVRKQYLKSLISLAGFWGTIATTAALAGAEVSTDSNSADFMKIKIGNTRLDPGAGFQQYIVAASRLISGHTTSSASGKDFELGQGYRPPTRVDIMQNFAANKLHPVVKFAYDMANASQHQPFPVADRTTQLFIPLIIGDVLDLAKEDPQLLPLIGPIALGMGSQTYSKGETQNKFIPQEYDWNFTGGELFGGGQ